MAPATPADGAPAAALWPACPLLPPAPPAMDWRALHAYREGERGGPFYHTALCYAQYLWQRGQQARAILALDRALFAEVAPDTPEVVDYPMPYAALGWLLQHHRRNHFLGNPRVSYQHLADRVRGPRAAQRRARAWACWQVVRVVLPQLPADPRHAVAEPASPAAIADLLLAHGLPGEAETFRAALARFTEE